MKNILKTLTFPFIMGCILFGVSGDIYWPMGYLFFILYVVLTFLLAGLFTNKHSDLANERRTAIKKAKKWDKIIFPFIAIIIPLATLIVSGLDHRFQWSTSLSLTVQLSFYFLSIVGCIITYVAMNTNRFFSSVVRIQSDRGHVVVKDGLYSYIRHPGYVGTILYNISMPLAIGSLWGLIPGVVEVLLFLLRTKLEDDTLQKELDGYSDYAKKVKYRLVPLVW
ncbi:MAG: isoprenylcysteine carboxylmethyltransferase family protein [Oligoflexia bacterium]|nr:isoprenylcysteine carboxylmethyltransferase family protein [Oligoflexia bacterium]